METISMCIGSFPPPGQIQSGNYQFTVKPKHIMEHCYDKLHNQNGSKKPFPPHTSSRVYYSFNKHCALTTVAPDVRGFLGRRESLGGAGGEVQRGRGAQGGQKRE